MRAPTWRRSVRRAKPSTSGESVSPGLATNWSEVYMAMLVKNTASPKLSILNEQIQLPKRKFLLFSICNSTDLLNALRNGEDVVKLIHENIMMKAKELGGQFIADVEKVNANNIENRSMITIGG